MPLLKLLESALLKHWLMMEFVAVKLKIIASLGGLCGDYQRGWNTCKKNMQQRLALVVGAGRAGK